MYFIESLVGCVLAFFDRVHRLFCKYIVQGWNCEKIIKNNAFFLNYAPKCTINTCFLEKIVL